MTNEEINALSDQQINVMVTYAVNELDDCWCESGDGMTLFHCGPTGESYYSVKVEDYCNDPAPMMPVVLESGIKVSMMFRNKKLSWFAADDMIKPNHLHFDAKPLRAAAIVYLKMKGVL